MKDEMEEIRARHKEEDKGDLWQFERAFELGERPCAHTDRATLLRLLDAARAEAERLEASNADLRQALSSLVDRSTLNILARHQFETLLKGT